MEGQQQRGKARQTITLVKGKDLWVFTWSPGDEVELLRALSDLADNERGGFEWFDAAVVSHQMGDRLGAGLHKFSDAHINE